MIFEAPREINLESGFKAWRNCYACSAAYRVPTSSRTPQTPVTKRTPSGGLDRVAGAPSLSLSRQWIYRKIFVGKLDRKGMYFIRRLQWMCNTMYTHQTDSREDWDWTFGYFWDVDSWAAQVGTLFQRLRRVPLSPCFAVAASRTQWSSKPERKFKLPRSFLEVMFPWFLNVDVSSNFLKVWGKTQQVTTVSGPLLGPHRRSPKSWNLQPCP